MTVTSFVLNTPDISSTDGEFSINHQHFAEQGKQPFDFKDITNFIMEETRLLKREASLVNENQLFIKSNAINWQIITLLSIIAIYMLLMTILIYFDR